MADVTVREIDEMDAIGGGVVRRARAELGVTAWGMQVMNLPANWDGYPEHKHDAEAFDPNQEEVYIPLEGSATLVVGAERFDLQPGTMARVGPDQLRQLLPGPEGVRLLALGGKPGSFDAGAWTEIGADPPGVESMSLAVVSVMQLLPARQRAVLILREVLGWSAAEVAHLLGDSVASVNSALQRARATIEKERAAGRFARDHMPASAEAEQAVVARFLAAWEAVDVEGLVSVLADDAVMTMPPEPIRIVGVDAIGDFFRTVPAEGALERIRLVPTRANGQPAVAAYLESDSGMLEAYGVMVFSLDGERVASITGFAGYPELFPELGLPLELEG